MAVMNKYRFTAVLVLLSGLALGYFDALHLVNPDSLLAKPFKFGLDLLGGVHLVYEADVSAITPIEIENSMEGLRDVIEQRVNLFGVTEPVVQIEQKGIMKAVEAREHRLIVELPGVTDTNQAIKMIGETPFLEFRLENPNIKITEDTLVNEAYIPSGLDGRFLEKSTLEFDGTTMQPQISLVFNKEGGDLFATITRANIDKTLAIFLDGLPISTPVIREEIVSGKAQISGQFTPQEAKTLVQRLNSGALPIPIKLISQQAIGPTLGESVMLKGINAGLYGILAVMIFLLFWYRFPGLIASLALGIYIVLMLALFKAIPITITAAGIIGFVMSVGMAVDANILIFERMKEELDEGKPLNAALKEGFDRAWPSIRDSNVSSLITGVILFWLGTSMVQGFALTFSIGILVSMFTAITVTKSFLLALGLKGEGKATKFLFGSGLK